MQGGIKRNLFPPSAGRELLVLQTHTLSLLSVPSSSWHFLSAFPSASWGRKSNWGVEIQGWELCWEIGSVFPGVCWVSQTQGFLQVLWSAELGLVLQSLLGTSWEPHMDGWSREGRQGTLQVHIRSLWKAIPVPCVIVIPSHMEKVRPSHEKEAGTEISARPRSAWNPNEYQRGGDAINKTSSVTN